MQIKHLLHEPWEGDGGNTQNKCSMNKPRVSNKT